MAAIKPWDKIDGLSPSEDLRKGNPLILPSLISCN
ncbi:hypothetical protein FJSC11DRAFT_0451 [Fischerella thermalis JSC-11]|jgi:hypothetical protein|uniref:Uncharacterized protein n=1 Tax=Fischerella thermalis JSC-11 TaxID=741277 RepID=G6FNK4_9CYAN|nr:hypothetical protein FJSC11DRAFT_0451 [Fischerella thermalis JSC-11]BAU06052.1 hypothetical protein FIS3754_19630 [Fischerella sp. NIES-3754]BCX08334.1 MAG: hypothetical protein KatS3mg066_2193 [Fischerella sp.]